MGKELSSSRFNRQDFKAFEQRLCEETTLLSTWFEQGRFASDPLTVGFEMEAWLIDERGRPVPFNERFIEHCNNPLVVPELAKFNVELNGLPRRLRGNALHMLHEELSQTILACSSTAAVMGIEMLMIGILPTLSDDELTLDNISGWKRFRALNEQVLRLRRGRPLHLAIQGCEHLRLSHFDVMLEAAATSFQLHLQVPLDKAVRFYNAACVLSAPMVAVSANSPYFFGKNLWDETRIPLFEQSVSLGGHDSEHCRNLQRVSFGSGFARHSLFEVFAENQQCFPILLPADPRDDKDPLAHVRLHNGTLWRWNRPLIGFNADGTAHLRIEHRVIPAGPSITDSIANAALFFGLINMLAGQDPAPESLLDFTQVRDSFYKAARLGLRASIPWLNGRTVPLKSLLCDELLPLARRGLEQLDIATEDIDDCLGVIEGRVRTGRNGAAWQRAYVEKHHAGMQELTSAYLQRQKSGDPVFQWDV